MTRADYTKEQEKYRKRLDCPQCGSHRTRFSFTRQRMMCDKCGNIWEKQTK